MKIASDFDYVLIQRIGIPTMPGWIDCEPVAGAVETMWELKKRGHDVYVFTCRANEKEQIASWLKSHKFPEMRITNIKEEGTAVYIDDRAIRFTNWQDIRKYFI